MSLGLYGCNFHNTCGADAEIDASIIGANGTRSGTVVYAAGRFSNGQSNYTSSNYVTFTNGFVDPDLGIIIFQFKPSYASTDNVTHGWIEMWDGTYQWDIYYQNQKVYYVVYFGSNKQVGYWEPTFASGSLYDVMVTFDASASATNRMRLYFDGGLEAATITTDNTWDFPTINLLLKQVQGNSNAVVDNLKVFDNRAHIESIHQDRYIEHFGSPKLRRR